MLKELRTTTTPRPKTPNKFYHQKNISNYFSTISNNAPTKNSSRENTLITSCDLLSNLERTSRTNLSNKLSDNCFILLFKLLKSFKDALLLISLFPF